MNETKYDFTAADLIPEWWDLVGVETIEDIKFLGQVTIRQMIRSWRHTASGLSGRIRRIDEEIRFLQGNNAESVRKIAERYENPVFDPEQIGVRPDSWGNDLEPLDEASKTRERGATTFNICGWCKHAAGGTGRYNYYISTHCSFITDAGVEDVRRRFNSPCFLKNISDKGFNTLACGLGFQLGILIAKKHETDAKIKFLLDLEKQAERKPALADHRPHDWFNVGDPVVCYIGGWERARLRDVISQYLPESVVNWLRKCGWLGDAKRVAFKEWATAKVIDGYRHHDGCVSVRYDERTHSGPYLGGHGGGYGMSRPEVMHAWEYDYLREHPDFAKVWMANTPSHLEGFEHEQMLEALTS